MSTSATAAPSAANACAAASPIPEPAPVTSETLFSKVRLMFFSLVFIHNFRCGHLRSALADRANVLAKRATRRRRTPASRSETDGEPQGTPFDVAGCCCEEVVRECLLT